MRILVTGASGQLGAHVLARLAGSTHEVIAWSGSEVGERFGFPLRPSAPGPLDVLHRALDEAEPDTILHLAAISSADAVRLDPDRAQEVNIRWTHWLAAWCADAGRRLLFASTDLVFDGSRAWNRESDPTGPLLAYGRTKGVAEEFAREIPNGLVIRLPLLFGPSKCGRPYFFTNAIQSMRRGEPQSFFEDEYRTPLDLDTAARGLLALADSNVGGTIHLAGTERVSRFELMSRSAGALGIDPSLVKANRRADVALAEPRPEDVSLDTSLLAAVLPDFRRPTIEEALAGP